jgi:hypothetical protein
LVPAPEVQGQKARTSIQTFGESPVSPEKRTDVFKSEQKKKNKTSIEFPVVKASEIEVTTPFEIIYTPEELQAMERQQKDYEQEQLEQAEEFEAQEKRLKGPLRYTMDKVYDAEGTEIDPFWNVPDFYREMFDGWVKEARETLAKREQTQLTVDFSKSTARVKAHKSGIASIRALDVSVESARWLWPGYIPAGKITILAGDPGLGKSTIAIDLISRISQGTFMPTGERTVTGACAVASAEDDAADTIVPRLITAGANLSRVEILRETEIDGELRYLSFPRDLQRLYDFITDHGFRMVVIDPLNAFLERGLDSHRDQDIRSLLAPLENIAETTGCAILLIAHLNKKEDSSALYRIGGSIGFIGAARSVLGVANLPESNHRVLYAIKTSHARRPASLAYEIGQSHKERKTGEEWRGENEVTNSRITWRGTCNFDPFNQKKVRDPQAQEARNFLKQILCDGELESETIQAEAKAAGIGWTTVRNVKADMGITSRKLRTGKWAWKPPDEWKSKTPNSKP